MFPRLFQLGGFTVPSYGFLVAIAFLTALWLASKYAKERGLDHEKVVNLGVYCALMGMLGAKVLMIALDPEFRTHPGDIFTLATLQSAGIFFGGFIGALVFAYFYIRRQGLPLWETCDIFAPGLAIGHGIGRLGCLAAGCCWGKPTHLPWGITFTNKDATTGVPLGIPLHPTQLYEALAEAVIFLVLATLLKRKHKDGSIIGLYLLLYGVARVGVEFLRMHDTSNPMGGPFTLEQWIALGLAIFGLLLVLRKVESTQPEPAAI